MRTHSETSTEVKKMNFDRNEYIESVEILAEKKSDFAFTTSNAADAAVVIAKIMEHANREVKIYDHNLNGDIAEQDPIFLSTLKRFILNGKKLNILLRTANPVESNFFDILSEYHSDYPDQIDIRIAHSDFKNNLKSILNSDVNYTVNDRNAYRVENFESEKNVYKEAICNFNNKEIASKLITLFDEQFNSCTPLRIPFVA